MFFGDSIARNLFQTTMTMLRGGGPYSSLGVREWEIPSSITCIGDYQYVSNSKCRLLIHESTLNATT